MGNKTTTWFNAGFGLDIRPVEIVRETAKMLIFMQGDRERRVNKFSHYDRYFPTREEAVTWLLGRLEARYEQTLKELERKKSLLDSFKLREGIK